MGKANNEKQNKTHKTNSMCSNYSGHHMQGSYQTATKENTWEKQQKQKRNKFYCFMFKEKHLFSNYSGHHMKGSYQQAKSTWEKHTKQTDKQRNNIDVQTSLDTT